MIETCLILGDVLSLKIRNTCFSLLEFFLLCFCKRMVQFCAIPCPFHGIPCRKDAILRRKYNKCAQIGVCHGGKKAKNVREILSYFPQEFSRREGCIFSDSHQGQQAAKFTSPYTRCWELYLQMEQETGNGDVSPSFTVLILPLVCFSNLSRYQCARGGQKHRALRRRKTHSASGNRCCWVVRGQLGGNSLRILLSFGTGRGSNWEEEAAN